MVGRYCHCRCYTVEHAGCVHASRPTRPSQLPRPLKTTWPDAGMSWDKLHIMTI